MGLRRDGSQAASQFAIEIYRLLCSMRPVHEWAIDRLQALHLFLRKGGGVGVRGIIGGAGYGLCQLQIGQKKQL